MKYGLLYIKLVNQLMTNISNHRIRHNITSANNHYFFQIKKQLRDHQLYLKYERIFQVNILVYAFKLVEIT